MSENRDIDVRRGMDFKKYLAEQLKDREFAAEFARIGAEEDTRLLDLMAELDAQGKKGE